MKIKPKDTIVKTILESNFLVIPRFQRPYSWDTENIADFWNDIFVSTDEDYFIGSMVFYRDNELSSEAYVVDGQQRLMTITILFAVIRDLFFKMNEKNSAKGLQRIIERQDINNKDRYTLTSQDPYPFFQDQIQSYEHDNLNQTIGDEERNIKNCYDELHERVKSKIDHEPKRERQIQFLQQLRDQALSVKVITVDLDNEDDAYLIFETLNTRGKDLTISDLVKNHITRMLRPQNPSADMVREKWKEIQKTIGQSISDISTNSFIVHYWISKYEYLPERKMFKSIRQTIEPKHAKSYLDELYYEAPIYRGIFEPQFLKLTKQERPMEMSLRAFSLFRLRQAAPFALALMSAYRRKSMSQANVAPFLKAIEHFHFKFTAVTSQRGAGGVALMYSRAARDLRKAKSENDKRNVCRALCGRFKDMQPPEAEFILGISEIFYSREFQSQRTLVRYILERFHRHFNAADPIHYGSMTIEHLMAQDANAPEEVKASLGNLLFVSEELNQKLKNKKFRDKKKILKEAGVKLDPIIAKATDWNQNSIERRLQYMAGLAYNKIWRL
jgi:hypothetical protein